MSQCISPPPSQDPCSAPKLDLLVEQLSEFSLQLMWNLRQEAVRAFEPLGLRPMKALLLELIGRGLAHPKALAEVLDTVPPTISTMLAELEERELVARKVDPEDRRRVQLELTQEGQTVRQQMKVAWQAAGMRRLAKLTPDEVESLVTIYRKLLEESL